MQKCSDGHARCCRHDARSIVSLHRATAAGGKVAGNHVGKVAGLLALIDAIPDSLLVLEPADYATLVASMGEIRSAVEVWQQRGQPVGEVDFAVFRNVRNLLLKCPDRAGTGRAIDLAFLKDADLEADLAMDITEVNTGLSNGEWKSATVVGGSIIEALLLWELQQNPARTKAAIASAVGKKVMGQPPTDLLDWTLHHCIEVAHEAGVVTGRTATLARLTKDYRNLIHPGRAQRLAQKPDRSTGLAAAAAVEAVLNELRSRHS